MPELKLESAAGGMVAGIDEAGRGPWAGPVVAAAVVLDAANLPAGIDDSKKLTRAKREHLFDHIHACARVGIGQASVDEIDELNILAATMLAMRRAVEGLPVRPELALIDGNKVPPDLPCPGRAVVKGDGISLSIAAASIIAKVSRDRLMGELDALHPGYGWAKNAGYGTAEHQAGLAHLGVTPHHRTSYAPIRRLMESS